MILCSYFTKLNNTLYYNHVFPLLGYIVYECHNISCHSILQSPPYVPCTFCWNFHEVTTEKSSHCQKRILAAIAKQQTATYGLFLSPFGKITKDQFNGHQQLKPNQQPLISQV